MFQARQYLKHFEPASELVTKAQSVTTSSAESTWMSMCGRSAPYREADFDDVYVNQIGPDQQGFFDLSSTSILPRLRDGCRLTHDLTLLRHDVHNGALNVPVKAEAKEPWLQNAGLLTSRTGSPPLRVPAIRPPSTI